MERLLLATINTAELLSEFPKLNNQIMYISSYVFMFLCGYFGPTELCLT